MPEAIILRQPEAPKLEPAKPEMHKPSIDGEIIAKIELDERCFLFPDGKVMSHLLITREGPDRFGVDAVYPFNGTRLPARVLHLSREEMKLFGRELLDSVYAAKSGFVLRDTLKVAIIVVANGYRIEFQRAEAKTELYLSTGAIWRVIRGVLGAVDQSSPVISN
jgi:hypothetical protein